MQINLYNQEKFLKIPHALCKCNIWFSGEFPIRKGKVFCYWIIIYLWRVIKMTFYWFIAVFLEDKKLKLNVLSLNSNLFCQCFLLLLFGSKDPSLLYKSSKGRNPLKPENLEIIFLLSTLKVPIKFVTSYHIEVKYLEEA